MRKCTVIGSQGFIGSELAAHLATLNYNIYLPKKHEQGVFNKNLGTVIYCAGNGDCLNTPSKVIDSNLLHLVEILEKCNFDRLIYLSSTRLYINNDNSDEETPLIICPEDSRRLFNLTKISAEEMCIKSKKNVIILRPSNVYGPAINSSLFLPMIVKDAIIKKQINMYVDQNYAKDYVSVYDLIYVITKMIELDIDPGDCVYNVGSGTNTKAIDIANVIQRKTGCRTEWHDGFKGEVFPRTSIDKLKSLIEYNPRNVLEDLELMIEKFEKIISIDG